MTIQNARSGWGSSKNKPGQIFLDASVPNGPNYNSPELIGDLKKLTGPTVQHTQCIFTTTTMPGTSFYCKCSNAFEDLKVNLEHSQFYPLPNQF